MVVINIKHNIHGGEQYLWNALNYVFNPNKSLYINGKNVDYSNKNYCFRQMMYIKKCYLKYSLNPLFHFIISFDNYICDIDTVKKLTKKCVEFFGDEYQYVYCIHKKIRENSIFHVHVIINTVNYKNGKLMETSFNYISEFTKHVSKAIDTDVFIKVDKS